jgi:hypothetical protein
VGPVRLEVSGGAGDGRVRRVLPLSPDTRDWLVGRLDAEAPALARRVAVAHSHDLVLVGRRDELPVLVRLLDDQAISVSPELGTLRRVATAAVEAEAAAAQRRRGRSR